MNRVLVHVITYLAISIPILVVFLLRKPYIWLFCGIKASKNIKMPFALSFFITLIIDGWIFLLISKFNTLGILGKILLASSLPLLITIACICGRNYAKEIQEEEIKMEQQEAERLKREAERQAENERKIKLKESLSLSDEERANMIAKLKEMSDASSFCETAKEMRTASEIHDAFCQVFSGFDNIYISEMMNKLERVKLLEDQQGNKKNLSCKLLDAFFKHDMRIFDVNRSGLFITCPLCGKEQSNKLEVCFYCGALFRD